MMAAAVTSVTFGQQAIWPKCALDKCIIFRLNFVSEHLEVCLNYEPNQIPETGVFQKRICVTDDPVNQSALNQMSYVKECLNIICQKSCQRFCLRMSASLTQHRVNSY